MSAYTYTGYGCPNTEMWMRRAEFETDNPTLDLKMRKDAPHYDSKATRVAYAKWEAEK